MRKIKKFKDFLNINETYSNSIKKEKGKDLKLATQTIGLDLTGNLPKRIDLI